MKLDDTEKNLAENEIAAVTVQVRTKDLLNYVDTEITLFTDQFEQLIEGINFPLKDEQVDELEKLQIDFSNIVNHIKGYHELKKAELSNG